MNNFIKYIIFAVVAILASATTINAVSLLMVPQGGTGADTFTDGGILLGSGTGAITALGVATNGQIPVGDGTTDPVLATISGGRSLTTTNGAGTISLAADAELYTHTKCIYWEDPVATDDFQSLFYFESAATITRLWCESDQTVTMTAQEDDGSPADIETTDLVCDSTPANQTSGFEDAAMAAGSRLDFAVASVASTPTWCSFCFTYTLND